ncbi:MAG TPA: rhodanese-like domain-containing protein [Gammaproteobacteria bacterium]|nr:rhodanese-like domain-containing protein [Gammaproteobacteria bacterium]
MSQLQEFILHHWVLFIILGVILALLAYNLAGEFNRGGGLLAPAQAVRLINRDGALVLDVREQPEFERGHIVNARHAPAATLDAQVPALASYRERPVLLYCAAGSVSTRACKTLQQAGFSRVHVLKGGLNSWRQENLPVVV